MKRTLFCGGLLLAVSLSPAAAQEFSWSAQNNSREVFLEMVANQRYRPLQVTTLEGFDLPLVIQGKEAGQVKVKAGTALDLVSVKIDGVIVKVNGTEVKLPVDKTDLIARFPARKMEVDAEFEKKRQEILIAGEQPFVLPPPVEEVVEPQKEIVYIDTSAPRINVNTVNYWPYTSYYPGSYYPGGYYPYPQYNYYPAGCGPLIPPYKGPIFGPKPSPVPAPAPVRPVVHPFAPARPGP